MITWDVAGILHLLDYFYRSETLARVCHVILLACRVCSCKNRWWVALHSRIWAPWKSLTWRASRNLVQFHQSVICFSNKNVVNSVLGFLQKLKIVHHFFLVSLCPYRVQLVVYYRKLLWQVLIKRCQPVDFTKGFRILLNDHSWDWNFAHSLNQLCLYRWMFENDVLVRFSLKYDIFALQLRRAFADHNWGKHVVCLRGY